MTTTLGLLGLALAVVMFYGAWRNMRPDHIVLSLVNPSQTVGTFS